MTRAPAIVALSIAVLATGVTGYIWYARYGKPIADAKDTVKEKLVDPRSAEFKNVRATATGNVCGEVNSKNRMGGYVGFKHFWVFTSGAHRNVLLDSDTLDVAQQLCEGK
jgi:hypothetical protein